MLTVDIVQSLLKYNPDTGKFYWNSRPRSMFRLNRTYLSFKTRFEGQEAGTASDANGCKICSLTINSKTKRYGMHRLAFYCMGKAIPKGMQVDHINHDEGDNRWVNLRLVNAANNSINSRLYSNNKTGHKGITKSKSGTYIVKIGNGLHVGTFCSLEEAILARKDAELSLYDEIKKGA